MCMLCNVTYMKHGRVLIIDLSCFLAHRNVEVTLGGGHTAIM